MSDQENCPSPLSGSSGYIPQHGSGAKKSTLRALRSVENISDVSQRQIARLHEEAVERYEQLVEELEGERETIARERQVHKARELQLQELERVQDLLRSENRALVVDVTRLEARQREHAQQLQSVKSENASLAAAAASAEAAVIRMEDEVAHKDALLGRMSMYETQIQTLTDAQADLEEENAALQATLEELAEALQQCDQQRLCSEAAANASGHRISELQEVIETLKTRVTDLQDSELEKSMQIEQLSHEVAELNTSMAVDTPGRLQSLQAELRAGRGVETCSRHELEQLVEAGANEIAGLEALVVHLNATLEAMKADGGTRAKLHTQAEALSEACAGLNAVAMETNTAVQNAVSLGEAAATVLDVLHGIHTLINEYGLLLDIHDDGGLSLGVRACAFADMVAQTAARAGIRHDALTHPSYGRLSVAAASHTQTTRASSSWLWGILVLLLAVVLARTSPISMTEAPS